MNQIFGPWKYDEAGATVRTLDDQRAVCDIRGFGGLAKDFGTSKAIALQDTIGMLISKSPDLLSELRKASEMLGTTTGGDPPACEWWIDEVARIKEFVDQFENAGIPSAEDK